MPAPDRSPTASGRGTRRADNRSLLAGALIVAVIVGAYVLIGAPGLHTQVANAPANIESTNHAAPGVPAPAPPAR
jgi:hypothetical protein